MSCSSEDDWPLFDLNNNETIVFLNSIFSFGAFYGRYHRYISFTLCLVGILANVLHICVLTRRQMRRSAVHTVLTCIAIADIGTMTSYMIYITRFEFFMDESGYSYSWAGFLKIHAVLSIALHATSIYLVCFMGFIRYLAMDAGHRKWMMPQPALIISTVIVISIFILCLPTFFAHQVFERNDIMVYSKRNPNYEKKYSISFSEEFEANNCRLFKINLWITGIFLKAVPCFLLLVFTIALLKKLQENERKRKFLLKTSLGSEKSRRITTDRTTMMLLLMVFVFLITELPQGIFAILNVWPDRVIPYTVDESIKKDPRQFYALLTAKAILENKSCLSLTPRRNEKSYIKFSSLGDSSPCWDIFGKTSGVVPVNVGPRCLKPFLDAESTKNQIFGECDLDFLNELYGCRNHILEPTPTEDCPPSQWLHFRKFRKFKKTNFPRARGSTVNRGGYRGATVTPIGNPKRPVVNREGPKRPIVSTRGNIKNPNLTKKIDESRVPVGNCSSACRYNGILTPLYQAFNDEFMVVNHFYTEDKLEQSQMLVKNYIKEPNLGYIGQSAVDRSCKCLKPLYRLHSDLYHHMYVTDQKEMQYHKAHPTTGYGLERIECFIWQFNVSTKACEE
ncbi:hypothetical protein FO519_002256 [Halicephalobus sp. NKZ332]|nr:hypothetical protein FO519_002256 [Halicephalobus sp. NKZ332]